jgi:methylated-DNA-[protein]-cysteine S-methyltransferase
MNPRHLIHPSPIGNLTLVADRDALTGLFFDRHDPAPRPEFGVTVTEDEFLTRVTDQLVEYFAGSRRDFDVPLAASGTDFQRKVWDVLTTIPYGEAISYVELATRVGNPAASRAVGGANGRNPISIIVPCHRVIQADRTIGGYGGGLPVKQFLLELEGIPYRRPLIAGSLFD